VSFFVQRTISWDDEDKSVKLIDQTLLPGRLEIIECATVDSLVKAIKTMQIRGAPAIGVAGAMGVALSLARGIEGGLNPKQLEERIHNDAHELSEARPTAVNLAWGVESALDFLKSLRQDMGPKEESERLIQFVKELADKDVEVNKTLSRLGQKLIHDNSSVLTHCN
jgi:methylthioribose-1-phosphate isomerase